MVGKPKACVKLLTVSAVTPDFVVSKIKCGVCFLSMLAAYLLQTTGEYQRVKQKRITST